MDGALLIDKKEGLTSAEVVNIVKEKLKIKKAGHTGTLDPIATGLLIILTGNATRFARFISELDKEYVVTAKFGEIRDTYDREGNIVSINEVNIECRDIEIALDEFKGKITQKPPPYSAKKIKGKRAYKLAREGKNVELKPVEVFVYEAELLDCRLPFAKIRYRVSSGTYIRTLIHDLGLYLGTGAYVESLRRTAIGTIKVESAVDLEEFAKSKNPEDYLVPVEEILNFMNEIHIPPEKLKNIYNGKPIITRNPYNEGYVRIYTNGRFIGVGRLYGNILKPIRLLPKL